MYGAVRYTLGVLSFVPLVVAPLVFYFLFERLVTGTWTNPAETLVSGSILELLALCTTVLFVLLISIFVSFSLISKRVPSNQRFFWMLALTFAGWIFLPYFWHRFIRSELNSKAR